MQPERDDEIPVSDAEILRRLDECRTKFKAGDKSQLRRCYRLCGQFQAVIPDWARDAEEQIERQLASGRVKDLNEAYGWQADAVDSRAAKVRRAAARHEIMTMLVRCRSEGKAFNTDLFEDITLQLRERRMDVRFHDVRDLYRANLVALKQVPQGFEPGATFGVADLRIREERRHGRPTLRD
jgi:hypothetical protein